MPEFFITVNQLRYMQRYAQRQFSFVWMRSLLIVLIGFCTCEIVFAQPSYLFPQPDNIYVNDLVGLLDQSTESKLTSYLQQVEERDGIQISLLLISDLAYYKAGPEIEPYATALFNHWGVGSRERNDGVLILVSRYDRRMRIELGSAYSHTWDRKMKAIIDRQFIPSFKDNEYQSGVETGVVEVIYSITGRYPDSIGNTMFAQFQYKAKQFVQYKVKPLFERLGAWAYAILVILATLIFKGIRFLWRRRPRSCSVCPNKMIMLDEQSDDQHIGQAQQLEEYLGSVDYDVWQCGVCPRIDVYRYKSFVTSYSSCSSCGFVTLASETTVLERATTSSQGLERIDYRCKNCDFEDYKTRTVARKHGSSSGGSSRSGGGGSFGGGRSGGGGASGSW